MKALLAEIASRMLLAVSRRQVGMACPGVMHSPEVPEELKK